MTKNLQVIVRIDPDLRNAMLVHAQQADKSLSAFIREACREYIVRQALTLDNYRRGLLQLTSTFPEKSPYRSRKRHTHRNT